MRALVRTALVLLAGIPMSAYSTSKIESLASAMRSKAGPNGTAVIYAKNLTKGTIKYQMNGSKVFATASNFKWYVLYSVARKIEKGQLSWNSPVRIRNEWRSIYNSVADYKNLAAGNDSISVWSLSLYMFKDSDNTATDHLMRVIGTDAIVSDMKKINKEISSRNTPMLTTSQAFKMKAYIRPRVFKGLSDKPIILANYYSSLKSVSERKFVLKYIDDKISMDEAEIILRRGSYSMGIPRWDDDTRFTQTIEWYSNAESLCGVIHELYKMAYREKGNRLYEVMSSFTPYRNSYSYEYGSKSGFESGISTMSSFFKRSMKSDAYCVVTAINNHYSNFLLKQPPNHYTNHRQVFEIFSQNAK